LAENEIEFLLDRSQEMLLNNNSQKRLQEALNEYFNKPMKISFTLEGELGTPALAAKQKADKRLAKATESIEKDDLVQKILSDFDGRILPDSIKPID